MPLTVRVSSIPIQVNWRAAEVYRLWLSVPTPDRPIAFHCRTTKA
jgi:hypothetical protein